MGWRAGKYGERIENDDRLVVMSRGVAELFGFYCLWCSMCSFVWLPVWQECNGDDGDAAEVTSFTEAATDDDINELVNISCSLQQNFILLPHIFLPFIWFLPVFWWLTATTELTPSYFTRARKVSRVYFCYFRSSGSSSLACTYKGAHTSSNSRYLFWMRPPFSCFSYVARVCVLCFRERTAHATHARFTLNCETRGNSWTRRLFDGAIKY